MVFRIYVEKKQGFEVKADQLLDEWRDVLGLDTLVAVRIVNRYDVDGVSEELFQRAVRTVFSEPQSDVTATDLDALLEGMPMGTQEGGDGAVDVSGNGSYGSSSVRAVFAVEPLPGQFDQRADSAAECIQLISQAGRPQVRTATIYVLEGSSLSQTDVQAVKRYVINPVESRETDVDAPVPDTLQVRVPVPADVERITGFNELDDEGLRGFIRDRALAMDLGDIKVCQDYFRGEGRVPTITEIKVVDTYWSDHCRHTTFGTRLDDVRIDDAVVRRAFDEYLRMRRELKREGKPCSLMDIGTIGAKWIKSLGGLESLDESEEVNACTVKVKVDVAAGGGHAGGAATKKETQDWLFLFKNETHNHPTEIEPFGGAATCIGGCIRDPLSGRSYVYQAMRVTGAGDPRVPVGQTLPGKLPQRKLVTAAAEGYSSYGNQIGLATGQVSEIYHPGYVAKRMEVGAVVGATPADHVRRETPSAGDRIILLGGRTGRDGIGGATGASVAQDEHSLEERGAEVQKGNAIVERKLQRLFRRKDACRLIKRCNDFGAGGVSVATGEIADGLCIDLDAVPKKYEGLDGTDLAISESQERMAVDVAAKDVDEFLRYAKEENLEATVVAVVTREPRMRMTWRGDTIVDLSREFLASNGAQKHQSVHIRADERTASGNDGDDVGGQDILAYTHPWRMGSLSERLNALVGDINVASNKGLAERFDSTIGAATVLMPFGGRRQLTPTQAMVAKFPVEGETDTASAMAWGFNPYISERNQYAGAYLAVVESLAKLVATGFTRDAAYLSFQEYFGRLGDDPIRWGRPTASVLGALMAQVDLGVAAIGGKDSMSGTFEGLDVPPTLISFAVSVGDASHVVSPEFKGAGHRIVRIAPKYGDERAVGGSQGKVDQHCAVYGAYDLIPRSKSLLSVMDVVQALAADGSALAISTPGYGAAAEALFKMALGNRIGLRLAGIDVDDLFVPAYGSFLIELKDGAGLPDVDPDSMDMQVIGETTADYRFTVVSPKAQSWRGCRQASMSDDDGRVCGSHADGFHAEPDDGDMMCESADLDDVQERWEGVLESVYPYRSKACAAASAAANRDRYGTSAVPTLNFDVPAFRSSRPRHVGGARPRVVIPVFPGNNCEYDSAQAFRRAGAEVHTLIINNLTAGAVAGSAKALAAAIRASQIVMIPGGFSGGDEPDGSAKFIAAFFRSPEVADAVRDLLHNRDGLMLGICNGFQALVKLGLLPYGDIVDMTSQCPTVTFNTIGRHQSRLVRTRVASTKSPWLSLTSVGAVHTVAVSHGEGRFVASPHLLRQLVDDGQIATQYVGDDGRPSMDLSVNPNGSVFAVEGVTSPDGRILGKMGHSERSGDNLYRNVPGDHYQPVFEAGVAYFA